MPNYLNDTNPQTNNNIISFTKNHTHSLIWHNSKSSFSYCIKCSTLFLSTKESFVNVASIKPSSFSLPNEFDFNIFSSPLLNYTNTCGNKKGYIKFRQSIIKEIKSSQNKYNFSYQTFFLVVYYLDFICSNYFIVSYEEMLQIAMFCMILAVKFNEDRQKAYEIETQLKNQIGNNYHKDEIYVLKLLNYNLNVITCYDYINMIINFGFLYKGENFSKKKMNIIYNQFDKMIYAFSESKKYIEMSPKQIALGVIGFARESLGLVAFNDLMKIIFEFNEEGVFLLIQQGLNKVKESLKVKQKGKNQNHVSDNNNNTNISLNEIESVQRKTIEGGFINNTLFVHII